MKFEANNAITKIINENKRNRIFSREKKFKGWKQKTTAKRGKNRFGNFLSWQQTRSDSEERNCDQDSLDD